MQPTSYQPSTPRTLGATSSNPPTATAATNHTSTPPKCSTSSPSRHRIHAYTAQAFFLSTVYGLALSHGPLLEHHHTTLFPSTPLLLLVTIPALHLLFLFAASLLAPYIHARGRSRAALLLASCAAVGAEVAGAYCRGRWWTQLLVRGAVQGAALGVLRGVGVVCLAGEYRGDVVLASGCCVAAAGAGAVVYTGLAGVFLREERYGMMGWARAGIAAVMLGVGWWATGRAAVSSVQQPQQQRHQQRRQEQGRLKHDLTSFLSSLGATLVLAPLLIYPLFTPLLLTSPPTLLFPDFATYTLLPTFLAAGISASIAAQPCTLTRLGPTNTFVLCAVAGAAGFLLPAWMPGLWSALVGGLVCGCALGACLALHGYVLSSSSSADGGDGAQAMVKRSRRFFVGSVLVGVGAAVGVCAMGWVVRRSGFRWAFTGAGVVTVAGGVLAGVVREAVCRRGQGFVVV